VILRVPVTAADIKEWVRRAADAINALIKGLESAEARLDAVEAADTALAARVTTIEGQNLNTRVTALETTARGHPFQQLAAAPGSPTAGQSYYDTVLLKVRTWDGAAWQNHW
jgi:hypothetical protein